MKIEWHEECLKNKKIYLQNLKEKHKQIDIKIQNTENCIDLQQNQINLALKKGLAKFDPEKFGVKRKK